MKRFLILVLLVVLMAGCSGTPTPTEPTPTTSSPIPTESPLPTPPTSPLPTESPLSTPQAKDAGALVVVEKSNQTMEGNTMSDFAVLLTAAAFLSLVANRLVEGLATPIFDKFKLDKFWLMYIAWGVGGVLVVVSGVNLFTDIPGVTMPSVLGLILSGLVAGGGSNFINELFDAFGQGRRGSG